MSYTIWSLLKNRWTLKKKKRESRANSLQIIRVPLCLCKINTLTRPLTSPHIGLWGLGILVCSHSLWARSQSFSEQAFHPLLCQTQRACYQGIHLWIKRDEEKALKLKCLRDVHSGPGIHESWYMYEHFWHFTTKRGPRFAIRITHIWCRWWRIDSR